MPLYKLQEDVRQRVQRHSEGAGHEFAHDGREGAGAQNRQRVGVIYVQGVLPRVWEYDMYLRGGRMIQRKICYMHER